ncbi:MAG TPA: bifunctional riboflavin kinase/FAD synthetase [Gemmataceae bacterium]|nr:bifunctional riboflavin kinase/FAD synthetase [Gemmataceae bacterium]
MAIHTLPWNEAPPAGCRGGAVSVGNFDGVHLGHVALLRELRRRADAVPGPAVALTFDPHPLELLRPESYPPPLTTPAERARLIEAHGADHVVLLRTTHDLLRLTAEEFFAQVLRGRFDVRAMAEGDNFGFGRGRGGNVATLAELCRRDGVGLAVVPPVVVGGEPVSSSRVRSALRRGDVSDAAECLGRPYRLTGTVATGRRRGATLGFPTANLERLETLVPGNGVYAVRAYPLSPLSPGGRGVGGEGFWPAAANVGPNPTFGENARKVEVHLIGFRGDLYGQQLSVDFLQRLRDTRPFGSVDELVAQLRADVERAREVVG